MQPLSVVSVLKEHTRRQIHVQEHKLTWTPYQQLLGGFSGSAAPLSERKLFNAPSQHDYILAETVKSTHKRPAWIGGGFRITTFTDVTSEQRNPPKIKGSRLRAMRNMRLVRNHVTRFQSR